MTRRVTQVAAASMTTAATGGLVAISALFVAPVVAQTITVQQNGGQACPVVGVIPSGSNAIVVVDCGATPSPTPTPTASPTPSPSPTASPTPTPSPTASPTPSPSPTPTPGPGNCGTTPSSVTISPFPLSLATNQRQFIGPMSANQSTSIPFTLDSAGNPNGVVFDMSPVDLGGGALGPYAAVISDCPGSTVPVMSRCQTSGFESASITMNNILAQFGSGCSYTPGRQYYLNIRPTSSSGTTLVVYTRK